MLNDCFFLQIAPNNKYTEDCLLLNDVTVCFYCFLLTCVAAKSQRSILMDNMHKSPRNVAMEKKGQETSTNTQETAQSATTEPSNSVRLFCGLVLYCR